MKKISWPFAILFGLVIFAVPISYLVEKASPVANILQASQEKPSGSPIDNKKPLDWVFEEADALKDILNAIYHPIGYREKVKTWEGKTAHNVTGTLANIPVASYMARFFLTISLDVGLDLKQTDEFDLVINVNFVGQRKGKINPFGESIEPQTFTRQFRRFHAKEKNLMCQDFHRDFPLMYQIVIPKQLRDKDFRIMVEFKLNTRSYVYDSGGDVLPNFGFVMRSIQVFGQ